MTDAAPRHPERGEALTIFARAFKGHPDDVKDSPFTAQAPDDGAASQVRLYGHGLDRNVGTRHAEKPPMPDLIATRGTTAPSMYDMERVSVP